MDVQFLESVFDDSIKYANFFNGRILTATDLRDEQTAALKRARFLGQTAGEGVAYGLNVTVASGKIALEISGGLAMNRQGDGLYLPGSKTTVELTLVERPGATAGSPFVTCDIRGATTLTGVVSTGFYLLAITGATRASKESAPHSGLNGSPACTNRYEEAGIQFKLAPLTNLDFTESSNGANRSRLAHAFFGTDILVNSATNPLETPHQYGVVDNMRADGRLSNCDVPLAIFHYQNTAVQFVDVWAVRRPCSLPNRTGVYPAGRPTWPDEVFTQFVSPRQTIEANAFLLQFQNHLEDLRTDSSIDPAEVVAAEHFDYLPAAGYLPIAGSGQRQGFQVARFFEEEITTQPLDPAYLRSVFHNSFYQEPIAPGEDAVDIYKVEGAGASEPYRIFVRRPPLIIEKPAEEPPEEKPEESEDPPVRETGELIVTVLYESGEPAPDSMITSVKAYNKESSDSYEAVSKTVRNYVNAPYQAKQFHTQFEREMEKTRAKYKAVSEKPKVEVKTIYQFKNLPIGTYTVHASPTRINWSGVSKNERVETGRNVMSVTIRQIKRDPRPCDPFIPGDIVLPNGYILDGILFDPRWEGVLDRDWEVDVLGGQSVDPEPDDWIMLNNSGLKLGVEESFGRMPEIDPVIAADEAEIYVKAGYDPTRPGADVNVIIKTQDGSTFPAAVLAADNALAKPTSADRTGLPDYDRATMNRLESAGLSCLDVLVSVPTSLLAGAIGQSPTYAQSLVAESYSILQEDFRNGFMSFVGINKEESDKLKAVYNSGEAEEEVIGDRVKLANAPTGKIAEALGGEVSESFTRRLLDDVRGTVSEDAYTLAGTSMSAEMRSALGGMTNSEFRNKAMDEAGREELKTLLGVPGATIDRYQEEAAGSYARGQFMSAPEKSVGALKSITPEVATRLTREGITSAKVLANSDTAELAKRTNISETEMTGIVGEAERHGSGAHFTLFESATRGAVAGTELNNAGLRSPGAVARADTKDLTKISGIDDNTAISVRKTMNNFLSGQKGKPRRIR